jgi:DNA gyrase subunit A
MADKKKQQAPASEFSQQDPKNILVRSIKDEISESYLNYSMSVIVGRAIPDVRDGLKPVHRRILFSMHEMGLRHNVATRKSARIVGDVIGKYHPHGDIAVYDALVRMAQDFSLRYPLIDGQGNFGSIDGDPPAAYRYTEARMTEIAGELLADIDRETVPFIPNFDETLQEPTYLPSKVPNLLINGSSGIAVGMSTSIPPFNLGEILDAVVALVDNDQLPLTDLIKIVPGPDFPTGALIMGQGGIMDAYRTGRGSITLRAKMDVETNDKTGKTLVVATEIPYMVNKAELIAAVAAKVNEGSIEGIGAIRDESDKEGMRIVFELNKKGVPKVVMNTLLHASRLQTSFHVMNLVLDNGQPRVLGMKELLQRFISHREDIITKRAVYDLRKAQERVHIIEGLLIAIDNIDEVIAIIKQSQEADAAKQALMAQFALSEIQAGEILDMRLRRLTGLERQKLEDERKELTDLMVEYQKIIDSHDERMRVLKQECIELKEKYSKLLPRRTQIEQVDEDATKFTQEDLIKDEDVAIILTKTGYIKRMPLSLYETQGRGGKGKRAMKTKEDDVIKSIFIASTHAYLLVLTTSGRMYWVHVFDLPEGTREAKGKPIEALIAIKPDEKISTVVPAREFSNELYLIIATKNGLIKKCTLDLFQNVREPGIIAITFREGDEVVDAKISTGDQEVVIGTKNGMACRFVETDIRPTGRNSIGVRAINLKENDAVIGMVTVEDNASKTLLTVTKKGYGKRTRFEDYRMIRRGGVGVRNIDTKLRGDEVICLKSVSESDELLLVSKKGNMVRLEAGAIKELGRSAAGYIVIRFKEEDDELVGVDLVVMNAEE